jgi:hypothetical protein
MSTKISFGLYDKRGSGCAVFDVDFARDGAR